MDNNTNVTLSKTITLPSLGKFRNIPANITIRAMSLLDEKRRLASNGVEAIVQLISRCVTSPENFDAGDLCQFDLDYAMIELRALSHGNAYPVTVTCPHCGATIDKVLDLSQLECVNVDDSFSSEFEIGPLPNCGDTLKVKILTYNDEKRMNEEAKKILNKFPNYEGDPRDILDYVYKVVEVNGEKLPYVHLKPYVENLSATDSIYFDEAYSDHLKEYGINPIVDFECNRCNESFSRMLPINDEFFRPKYYSEGR